MVALLLLWGTAACTDEVLVDMEKPGIENNSPEAGRITSLKNILPDAKPGYQGVDSREETSTAWDLGDELLLKIQIKDGDNEKYTAWMTLLYNVEQQKWGIKDNCYYAQKTGSTEVYNYSTLPLVKPQSGIILNGENPNFEAIIPEEISEKNLLVSMFYAPDLEWKQNNNNVDLGLKENPSTHAPEFWEVTAENSTTQWTTNLARVKVQVQYGSGIVAGDVLALTAKNYIVSPYAEAYVENTETETPEVQPVESSEEKTYLATSDTEGYAYFYGTLEPTISDFNISLKQVKISSSDAAEQPSLIDAFIPTTLFEANTLNKVTLVAKTSYLLDGTDARAQVFNNSKPAVKVFENNAQGIPWKDGETEKNAAENLVIIPKEMTVYGLNGLLEYIGILNRNDGVAEIKLKLANDIVLPQLKIVQSMDETTGVYTYKYEEPTSTEGDNWSNCVPINGDFGGCIEPVSGTDKITISGLRLKDKTAFINHLVSKEVNEPAYIKNLNFVDAIISSKGNAAVIVSSNDGRVEGCTVANSKVNGCGDVGAVVAINKGVVSDCHNKSTDVFGGKTTSRASELVGGVVGQNYGDKSINPDRAQGLVTNCTNSGKVISNGAAGNNFTGGIVGHSYGIVSYCTNTGYVESSTDGTGVGTPSQASTTIGYYTSVGGVVGNCSFGRVIACINEGKVKSGTTSKSDVTTHNRVGGVVGYSGTESHVVACGNTGDIEISGAQYDHVGGIVGHLYHSYKYDENNPQETVENSQGGKVYASWTKQVLEKGYTNATAGDGIGDIDDRDGNSETTGVFVTKVFNNMSLVDNTSIASMNSVINNADSSKDFYNKGLDSGTVKYCSKIWTHTPGSWPTLTPGTTSTNP